MLIGILDRCVEIPIEWQIGHSPQSIQTKRRLHRQLMKKISRSATIVSPFDSITTVTKQEKTNVTRIVPNVLVKRL